MRNTNFPFASAIGASLSRRVRNRNGSSTSLRSITSPQCTTLGLFLLLLLCSGCEVDRPSEKRYEVVSNSMFPALQGPTRQATCPSCQNHFPIAAESFRATLPTRCGNCGDRCQVSDVFTAGQTVSIVPISKNSPLQRFDLVAFDDPKTKTTQVKRVWGLPGEEIQLQRGELFVDGVMFQKSLAQFGAIAVPLSDLQRDGGRYWQRTPAQPHFTLPQVGIAEESLATPPARGAGISRGGADPWLLLPTDAIYWSYRRPAPVYPSEVPADQWMVSADVLDDYSINQGISTELHRVDQLALSIRTEEPLSGSLIVSCHVGMHDLTVEFLPTTHSTAQLPSAQGLEAESLDAPPSNPVTQLPESLDAPPSISVTQLPESLDAPPSNPVTRLLESLDAPPSISVTQLIAAQSMELCYCDGRWLLETDRQSLVIDLDRRTQEPEDGPVLPQPTWHLTSAAPVKLTQLRVLRDLYLHGVALERAASALVEGYFVLGDNVPVSLDSRGALGRISVMQVQGRVAK